MLPSGPKPCANYSLSSTHITNMKAGLLHVIIDMIINNIYSHVMMGYSRVVQLAARGPHPRPAERVDPAREAKSDFIKIVKMLSIIQ